MRSTIDQRATLDPGDRQNLVGDDPMLDRLHQPRPPLNRFRQRERLVSQRIEPHPDPGRP